MIALTVNICELEVPPPGIGLNTVIEEVPTVSKSVLKISAVSCVEVEKYVVLAEPLKFTVELATKFVPLTVKVKPASPAVFEVGEIPVVVGIGFEIKFQLILFPPSTLVPPVAVTVVPLLASEYEGEV